MLGKDRPSTKLSRKMSTWNGRDSEALDRRNKMFSLRGSDPPDEGHRAHTMDGRKYMGQALARRMTKKKQKNNGPLVYVCVFVCVVHIKPSFLTVDIRHNQSVSVPILQS